MAISKSRLEELIEQGATVYEKLLNSCITLKLNKNRFYVKGIYLWKEIKNRSITSVCYPIKDLYETREDAEFAAKYKNITRTETLSLPTFDEIQKDFYKFKICDNYCICEFFNGICRYSLDIYKNEKNECYIGITDYGYFEKATKENYLQACSICRKLFLGEDV